MTAGQFAANFEAGFDQEAESWCLDGRQRYPEQGPFVMCMFQLHAWGSLEPQPHRHHLGR